MKHLLFTTMLVNFLLSCNSNKPIDSYALMLNSLPIPKDSSTRYFPLQTINQDSIAKDNSLDTFVNTWYSQMLFALHEPLLFKYIGEKEIFRFTWLRSFHNPVSIRIERQNNEYLLFAKVADGAGGYEPGQIVVDTIIAIQDYEWNNFIEKIKILNFWKLPLPDPHDGSMDGARWVLEGTSQSKYHIVDRQSPGRDSDYGKCCMYLLKLSKIEINEKDQY